MGSRQLSDQITKWLYTRDAYHMCPETAIRIMIDKLKHICARLNLSLAVSEQQIYTSMCEATCVMYKGKHSNKVLVGPRRTFTYPTNWSNELEDTWDDYLKSIFTFEFWEKFWSTIRCESLENDIPAWKSNIQEIYPLYIMRQTTVLYNKGYLNQIEEKNSDDDEYVDDA